MCRVGVHGHQVRAHLASHFFWGLSESGHELCFLLHDQTCRTWWLGSKLDLMIREWLSSLAWMFSIVRIGCMTSRPARHSGWVLTQWLSLLEEDVRHCTVLHDYTCLEGGFVCANLIWMMFFAAHEKIRLSCWNAQLYSLLHRLSTPWQLG